MERVAPMVGRVAGMRRASGHQAQQLWTPSPFWPDRPGWSATEDSTAEPRQEVGDRDPPGRGAQRYAQNLDGEDDRPANEIRGVRTSSRAPVVDHAGDNQRISDQRRQ